MRCRCEGGCSGPLCAAGDIIARMTLSRFRLAAVIALSFAAGSIITMRLHAQSSRVFELLVYHTFPGRLPALQARFRDHTISIFKKHHMESIGYWVPQDADKGKENTLIYIIAHPSRDAAKKNWAEFGADPEWKEVAK